MYSCLELAKLAAIAVDFPKTGKLLKHFIVKINGRLGASVSLPPELIPKAYPDCTIHSTPFLFLNHFQLWKDVVLHLMNQLRLIRLLFLVTKISLGAW